MSAARRTSFRRARPFPRVAQFCATLTHRHSAEIDAHIQALLANEDQWRLVAQLSTFDRAHHLNVHAALVAQGYADPDLLRAALLHDVGKANGVQRVRLWHRIARVAGRRAAPRLWRGLSQSPGRFTAGLHLAEHHARLGANKVRTAGGAERCCDLIARHEQCPPTGDTLLDALIAADEEA